MLTRKKVFGLPISIMLMAIVIAAAMVAANSATAPPAEATNQYMEKPVRGSFLVTQEFGVTHTGWISILNQQMPGMYMLHRAATLSRHELALIEATKAMEVLAIS